MAEEQGDKNEIISDSDKKMDALMDMIKDACSMMDSGMKRLDARMDAADEKQSRMDARMDSMRKDESEAEKEKEAAADKARKDAEEAEKAKGEPEEPAADKARKDAEEKEAKEKEAAADKARKDAEEAKEKEEAHADANQFMTRAEAAELRATIAKLQANSTAVLSDVDRERFAAAQERADPVFQAFSDRAPAPMDGETVPQYKRRLGSKLQVHSPRWKDGRLSAISDESILDTVLEEVYADSMAAANRGVAVPRGQLRPVETHVGGHTYIDYVGEPDAWMNRFAGHSQRGTGSFRVPNA